jgi:HK97 family phage major capsid protein
MADIGANIPRAGSVDNGSDKDALFLQVFSGEVLSAFEEANVMRELHTVRTISEGKSASFPVTGVAGAAYLTAGEDIYNGTDHLSKIKHSEKVITIDDLLVSSTFIADIDSLRNHFDLRSIYSNELGKALAKRFDLAVMKTLVAGAGAGTATDQPAGISITGFGAFSAATGEKVVDAIVDIAQKLDENDIPDDGDRFAVLPPELYYLLISDASGNIALNKDYGGVGSIAQGNVPMVAGIKIFKSNHVKDIAVADASQIQDDDNAKNNPFDDAGASATNGYNADLSTLRFIGGHKSSVGTVKLLDLATDMDYSVQRQGTLLVAKYAMGHNFLRQGACVKVVN